MTEKLVHGIFRRVDRGRVRDVLTGKIHESFTVAADQLFQRGYMNEEERIALSGVIGGVLPKFQEEIDDSVGNRPVETDDLRAIAEKSLILRTHSRSKCMQCDKKPTVAVHWANGHGMAWFCDAHFKEWLGEDDRDICGVWVLEEGKCPEDIRKTPKGTTKIRKLGDDVSQKEIYQRIADLTKRGGPGSGHHGHRGREREVGGSLPSGARAAADPDMVKTIIGESERDLGNFIDFVLTRHYSFSPGMSDEENNWRNVRSEWIAMYQYEYHDMKMDEGVEWIDSLERWDRTVIYNDVERAHLGALEGQDFEDAVIYLRNNFPKAFETALETLARDKSFAERGGPGSGHHGHRGVQGQTGGSLPRARGTHLGGLGVPDLKDASKRSFVSQRIMQVEDETVVALVSLRRLDVFKTKPYRMESRWYVKDRKGPATSGQQDAGAELLKELEINTAQIMEISGWQRSTYRDNLWVAPWGSVLHIPTELTTRGGEGSGHFDHAGRPGEVGGSAPGKGGPTGGIARPRHAPGVTPVSGRGGKGGGLDKGAKGKIRKNLSDPFRGGKTLDKASEEEIRNTFDILKQFELDELREMQDEATAGIESGAAVEHFQMLDRLLGEVVLEKEFGDEDEGTPAGTGGQVEELPHEQEMQMTSLQAYLDEPTQRSEDGIFGVAYTEDSWTDLATEIMENQPPEIQKLMAEAEQKIREGSQSIEQYRDPETGEWNPERRALHERIIQGVMKEAGEAPERGEGENSQIWVTGGLPGAGKSSVLEHREAFPEGTVRIDSDKIKTMLPEYEGWNAALLHEESSAIVQELFRRSTSEGRDLVYDATLKTTSKAEELMSGLGNMNYDVNVIYVDIPMAMSMERAINRFVNEGGRYVSPMYIATHDSKNVKTLSEIRDNVTSWEHWDNSQPAGQEPTLLATGGKKKSEGDSDAL